MQHKIIAGRYGIVHYWVNGEGKDCLIFTHGATMDHGLFARAHAPPQVDYSTQSCKVISWDVPLHGLSRPYEKFSLQKAAQELVIWTLTRIEL